MDLKKLKKDKYCVIEDMLTENQIHDILFGRKDWTWTCIDSMSSTRSKTKTKSWTGVYDINLNDYSYVELPDKRVDINLPIELYSYFNIFIEQLPACYRIYSCNLLLNPPKNKNVQDFHQDYGEKKHSENYYSIIIPLVDEIKMGKTQILLPYTYNLSKNIKYTIHTPNVTTGNGLCYSGCLWHRGTANLSNNYRSCIYLVIVHDNLPDSNLSEKWIL